MFLQYFDTVGWVLWPVKTVARVTYTVLVETLNPAQSISQNRAGSQIIFVESGHGLGHVTSTIFGIRSNISSILLELETSNLVCGFVLPLLIDCQVLHTIVLWGSTVGYPSDSLSSCFRYCKYDVTLKRLPAATINWKWNDITLACVTVVLRSNNIQSEVINNFLKCINYIINYKYYL